jgi:uncharacterized protein YcfJ
MKINHLYVGLAGILVGSLAVAAYQTLGGDYAEVIEVTPVTRPQEVHAEVLSTTPVRQVVASPRQVCSDVATRERLPERDGDVGGTVAGAVIGGLLGNQVGRGDGRKLATVAGAVAGGYAGREIDRRHQGGRVVDRTQRECQTISEAREQVVGYDVSYRTDAGEVGEMRSKDEPGERVSLGLQDTVIAYDVTYRLDDVQRTVRMRDDPGDRLPVVDGRVVLTSDAGTAGDG